ERLLRLLPLLALVREMVREPHDDAHDHGRERHDLEHVAQTAHPARSVVAHAAAPTTPGLREDASSPARPRPSGTRRPATVRGDTRRTPACRSARVPTG